MNSQISVPKNALAEFCREHGWPSSAPRCGTTSVLRATSNFSLSLSRTGFPGCWGLPAWSCNLSELFGREVDLVKRSAVERSRNYIRRRAILDSAEEVYAA